MIEHDKAKRGTGTLMDFGAAVAYRAAGLLTRIIALDVWTLCSCLLTSLGVVPLASGDITAADLGKLVLFGCLLGAGQALLTIETRLVSATETALIGTLDAPLAPLRVWLAVDGVRSWQTVVGGSIVMTGVATQILVGIGSAPMPHR